MRLAHLTAALTLIAATTLTAAPARADISAGFSVPLIAGDGDAGVGFVMQGHGLLQTQGDFRAEASARTSVGTWVLGWGPSGSGGVEAVAGLDEGLHVRADFEVMGLTLYEEDLGADPDVVVDLGTYYPIPNGLQIGVAFGPVFFGIEGNVGVTAAGVMFTDLDLGQQTMTASGGLNVGGIIGISLEVTPHGPLRRGDGQRVVGFGEMVDADGDIAGVEEQLARHLEQAEAGLGRRQVLFLDHHLPARHPRHMGVAEERDPVRL